MNAKGFKSIDLIARSKIEYQGLDDLLKVRDLGWTHSDVFILLVIPCAISIW